MRKLGRVQKDVLYWLVKRKEWNEYSRWVWSSPSVTERILLTLVRRGLVRIEIRESTLKFMKERVRVFVPTKSAIRLIEEEE